MQVVVGSVLVAEVIGEPHMFGAFVSGGGYWERWAAARHRRGLSAGGAIISRADLPRRPNVPVGAFVDQPEPVEVA
jgi:hypothetical protein